jgi:hypothetical protein
MWEMRADGRPHSGEQQRVRVNPADPFMVRAATAQRPVDASPEQRRTLQRLHDAGRRVSRQEVPLDLLASLLRGGMVALYGDRVELTTLGALALATPLPASPRNQR